MKVDNSVIANYSNLPKGTQDQLAKLVEQIETVITPAKRPSYEALVSLIVNTNPGDYSNGDLPARHIAAQIMTFFDVTQKV